MNDPFGAKQLRAEKLAEEHWNWLVSVLDLQRQMERKLFIDAFIHGYKHREEEKEEWLKAREELDKAGRKREGMGGRRR